MPLQIKRALSLWVLLQTLGLAAAAQAQEETRVDVTETFTVEYRADNKNGRDDDDNYGITINRTNLTATSGDITTQMRIDGTGLYSEPSGAYRDDLRLERLSVDYSLGDWTLTGGDFFQQLGRGMALSIRKVNELSFDLALRGGRINWAGESNQVTAFAGRVNPANFDNVSQRFIEDPNDIVAGGLYEFYGWDAATLAVYGVYLQPDERLIQGERDWTGNVGTYFDGASLTDWLGLYFEVSAQQRKSGPTTSDFLSEGTAAYLNSTLTLGDTTLLLEGLYLDKYEVRGGTNTALGSDLVYNQPPTLERIDQEVLNNRDVRGGRARLEHYFFDWELLLFVNSMLRFTDWGQPNESQQTHHFAGFNWTYQEGQSRIGAIVGRRDELLNGEAFKTLNDAQLDYVQHLSGPYALHVMSWNEFRTLEGRAYRRGSTFLGLEVTDLGSLTLEYGFDTQNPSKDVSQQFLAGIVAWRATDAIELRSILGTQRGGLKCIAGVCREFPSFAGARLEVIGRF